MNKCDCEICLRIKKPNLIKYNTWNHLEWTVCPLCVRFREHNKRWYGAQFYKGQKICNSCRFFLPERELKYLKHEKEEGK